MKMNSHGGVNLLETAKEHEEQIADLLKRVEALENPPAEEKKSKKKD
jgi:hypothetical protein